VNRKKNKGMAAWVLLIAALFVLEIAVLHHYGLLFAGSEVFQDNTPPVSDHLVVTPSDSVSGVDVTSGSDSTSSSDAQTPEAKVPQTVTIQMTGDVLIHGSVTKAASIGENTYDFKPYVSLVKDAFVGDIRIANLETPIDVNGGNVAIESYPTFNVPHEILDAVKEMNIGVVSTAHNHSIDQGYEGLCATLENIKASGLTSIGTYANEGEKDVPFILEINGIKVGMICITAVHNIPIKDEIGFSVNHCKFNRDSIISTFTPQIQRLKENGAEFIVGILHWGTEYVDNPSKEQKEIARELCDIGIDVLYGGHSHCVQPIELYTVQRDGVESKALIVYSLGNFFANQTGLERPKTQYGMIVSVKAERGEDGAVRLADAFYLPTYCYVRGGTGESFMRICYPGKLSQTASFEEYKDVFKNEAAFDSCKSAWHHVTSVAGDDIPAVTSPDEYPEGFFSAE